ncbi:MAG: alr [Verrucomicrobia bacterium]|jgi:alanine racemase|nr:alr [Verrucomicrobiota bacterium]
MSGTYRCWAEIDLSALRENLGWLRHAAGSGQRVITVVKADAYGHGLKQIAALLMQSGTDVFGVANLNEARAIRSVGKGWPILMLGACLPDEVEAAVKDQVMPTISSLEEAQRFSECAGKHRRTVEVHLKVDTGMGRLGAKPGDVVALAQAIGQLPHLSLRGLYSHYASAEDDARYSKRQREMFLKVVAELEAAGIKPDFIHLRNSGGGLFEADGVSNTIRPGLLVYGIIPVGKRRLPGDLKGKLRPALTWKCRVSFVKSVEAGQKLSYGGTFTAAKRMKVATITAGYGDGYLRSGSGRAQVLIGGKLCPVLGRVTMDQMLVDVSRIKNVAAGDEVVLLGQQEEKEIAAGQLAEWLGTIPWEVLTSITYRVGRVYRGGYAA